MQNRKRFPGKTVVRLFLLLLCCSILPLLTLGALINQSTVQTLDTQVTKMYEQTIRETSLSISINIQPFIDMLNYNAEDVNVISALSKEQTTEDQQRETYENLKQVLLDRQAEMRVGYPHAYLVISQQGLVYSEFSYDQGLSGQMQSSSWLQRLLDSPFSTIWIGIDRNITPIGHRDRLYIAAPVFSGSENLGVLIYAINVSFLEKQLNNAAYSEQCSVFLLDDDGNCVIAAPNNAVSYDSVSDSMQNLHDTAEHIELNGSEFLVTSSLTPLAYTNTDWRIVAMTPTSDVNQETIRIRIATISMTILLVLVDILLLLYISDRYFAPVMLLHRSMLEVRHGNLKVQIRSDRKDEIGDLHDVFDDMVVSLEKSIRDVQEKEQQKRNLELRMLQEQIRPHFVSNTLNTIRIMADMRRATGISTALTSFNNLIDYYFRDSVFMPTIREDTQHLQQYVYLQNLRYQNRFILEEDIEPQVYEYHILKLLLQPLVENCIKHGFQDRSKQGIIRIIGRQEGSSVLLQVADNGVGMDAETVSRVFSEEGLSQERVGEQQGVSNVHRRVRLHFGEPYGLAAQSTPGVGTTITLTLPKLVESESDVHESSDR